MAARASSLLHLAARTTGIGLAVLLMAAAATLWWAGQTTSFLRWALERAVMASGGALEVGAVRGTLAGGFGVASLRWRDDASEIELRDVSVAWRPEGLMRRELHVSRLEIGSASVRVRGAGRALSAPASLGLPIDVRLDAVGVGRLFFAPAGAEAVELQRVGLAGRYRLGEYRVAHLSAQVPKWGEATVEGRIGEQAPFALEASARVAVRVPGWQPLPPVKVLADGTLEDIRFAAQAFAPPGVPELADAEAPRPVWLGIDTRARPFAYPASGWLAPIELRLDGVEPGQIGIADAPRARVSGTATLRVDGERAVSGRLSLRNALPGPANRRAIPVSAIETSFSWSPSRLELAGLRAILPGGASIAGEAAIDLARRMSLFGRSLPPTRTRLVLRNVDLSRVFDGMQATRLDGEASLDEASVAVALRDASRPGITAAVRARVDRQSLHVEQAQLGTSAGVASARGTVGLAAPWRVDLAGEFRDLDPAGVVALSAVFDGAAAGGADLLPQWATTRLRGRLSGAWAAQGAAWPDPQLSVRIGVERGVLDGQPLRASFHGDVSRARIGGAAFDATLGDLQASAQGSVGRAGDRLRFSLRAATLARLDPRLDGSMSASGELIGAVRERTTAASGSALGIVADIEGRRLRWADTLRIGAMSGRIELADLQAGRLAVRADAEALQFGGRQADHASVRADGDAAAHELLLELSGAQMSGRASARGALVRGGSEDWHWEATVTELLSGAPVPIRLESPARLSADRRGIALAAAALQVDGGSVRVDALGWQGGRIELRGQASGLPVARWAERFAGPQALPAAEGRLEDVRLHGSWSLAGASLQSLSGQLVARLDAGDAAGSRGEADLALDDGRLAGAVDIRIPTLAFANRLIGPEWAVTGRLRFVGRVGGSIARPRLEGELSGAGLALLQRTLGWKLDGGTLSARFDGDRLDLQALRLESGGGSIVMTGQLLLDGMHGGFVVRAERLPVPIGPGQKVVVSGVTGVVSSGTNFEWKGDIRADEGLIELRGGDAPSLPDDVVIVDRRAAGEGASSTPASPGTGGFRIGADLNLDLGERLQVRGSGIDVVLAGALNLRGTLPAAPRAYGTVRVRHGTYSAYGQRLEIQRGQVVFNGPLDNPVLDIVAMRRNQAVEAGVALSGTVLSPRLRLVSTPDVPDSQKLSWLVLGVGLDDVRTAGQSAALQAAAATLFGSNDGGLSAGLAGALGLDMLTVRSAGLGGVFDPNFGATFPGQATTGGVPVGTVAQNVVAIGKRLSSRLFLTYEQGLRGVWNLLRIQYDITNRLSVRAQAGTENAVDVLYFYSFD